MIGSPVTPSQNGHGSSAPSPPRAEKAHGLLAHLVAIVRQRCPRCLEGRIFRGSFTMNDPCPVCGLIFQREEGYFLGAMYASYLLSCVLLGAFYLLGRWLFPDLSSIMAVVVACVPYVPLIPAVFRYSRVLWIHFERWVCPSDVSAGLYEKTRRPSAGPRS